MNCPHAPQFFAISIILHQTYPQQLRYNHVDDVLIYNTINFEADSVILQILYKTEH